MRISCLVASLIATFAVLVLSQAAPAGLLARIDKSAQRTTVNGQQLYEWPVSTGGSGYDTQNGTFKPFRMEIDHYSEEWTTRRCRIRSYSPRSATPSMALPSSAISVMRCRMGRAAVGEERCHAVAIGEAGEDGQCHCGANRCDPRFRTGGALPGNAARSKRPDYRETPRYQRRDDEHQPQRTAASGVSLMSRGGVFESNPLRRTRIAISCKTDINCYRALS
jgi:hypothetical protein